MKLGRVIELKEYQARRDLLARMTKAGTVKQLPDQEHLWELLDRNISLDAWKKGH